jgi:hypothetical protein
LKGGAAGFAAAENPLYQRLGEAAFNERRKTDRRSKSGLPGETFDHVRFNVAGA